MLTPRQNVLETIHGGSPDRFVNQYEFMEHIINPMFIHRNGPKRGEENKVNDWGVTFSWREDQPGAFPVHTPGKIVCEDVEEWRDCVKAPLATFAEAEWEPFIEAAEKVDRSQQFVTSVIAPGGFEILTNLCGMEGAMCSFYESPEDVHDLIKYLTEYELEIAEGVCSYIKPDCVFRHDDWGSANSTFLSPDMFAEFFLESNKQIYGYYRDHGVELVIHHSDSYAATLVPYMIEMGVDIWQGVLRSNNIPELIKKYGGQISFMGGIENSVIDRSDWTRDLVMREVRSACEAFGSKHYIPSMTGGNASSAYAGVYECATECINECSKEMFA